MHTTILTKDKFGTQPALDDAPAAEVKAHSEVDQATANLAYKNHQLVVTQIDRMKVGDPVRVGVNTYPPTGRSAVMSKPAVLPAAESEFALVPPDNATGNFTKIVRRFTVRIRFNCRDGNAVLARPDTSVETAVAVSTPDDASPTERGNRVSCPFDPSKDMAERLPTKLPEHPGLGRARPQGSSAMQIPAPPGH